MIELLIVDTDILIDASRGMSEAIDYLDNAGQSKLLAVSIVTKIELIIGCRNKIELLAMDSFLSRFRILEITDQISNTAANLVHTYNLSHNLLMADALIAATAMIYDAQFVSKNQRDFRFIKGLKLLPYP